MAQTKNLTLHVNEPAKPIKLPRMIRIEKEGSVTRAFCSVSGAEILPVGSVKLDMSHGKEAKAKLTIECEVTDIEVISPQLSLLDDTDKN